MKRVQRRWPRLTVWNRLILGVCALFAIPKRLSKLAMILQPSALLGFHQAVVKRKYHLHHSSKIRYRPGPKGPSKELIGAMLKMKRRNLPLRLPGIYRAHIVSFRDCDQQRCRSPHTHSALPTRIRPGGAFMAFDHQPCQGQSVEPQLLSLRIDSAHELPSHGRDGHLHSPHDWLWGRGSESRWPLAHHQNQSFIRIPGGPVPTAYSTPYQPIESKFAKEDRYFSISITSPKAMPVREELELVIRGRLLAGDSPSSPHMDLKAPARSNIFTNQLRPLCSWRT